MPQSLDKAVIRILNQQGDTVGTGFLVADRLAVTCAHVIEIAKTGPNGMANIRFLCDDASQPIIALVLTDGWSPADQEDVAYLQLLTIPSCAVPLKLAKANGSGGHRYLALGYPRSVVTEFRYARDEIVELEKARNGHTLLLHLKGNEITYGMSGGPVLDLALNRVVGMITKGQDDTYIRFAYATPAETLQGIYPILNLDEPEALLNDGKSAAPTMVEPLPCKGVLPAPSLLPPGSRMPFLRNAVFTGRDQDLLSLANSLVCAREPGRVGITQPVAASGLGGIGKTQLAVEFCYRYGKWFEGVYWISAGNENELDSEIAHCGMAMGLPNWPEKLEEQVAVTLRAWVSSPRCLVVLDNLEEPETLRTWLPRMPGIRVLITTRRQNWPRELGVEIQQLDVLKREESRNLMRKLAPRLEKVEENDLDQLAIRLGDLPLAIDLAGRYLEECSSCSITSYLTELDQVGSVLAHHSLGDWISGSPTGHTTNLDATFGISWFRLGKEGTVDTFAKKIYQAAGYFVSNVVIPKEVIWKFGQHEEEVISRHVLERALRRLFNLGLLSEIGDNFSIHPLLTDYSQRIKDENQDILKILIYSIEEMIEDYDNSEVDPGPQFSISNIHLEKIALTAEAAQIRETRVLWNYLGSNHYNASDFDKARMYFMRALSISEEAYGPNDINVATDLNGLGLVLRELGNLEDAKKCHERQIEIEKLVYGSESAQLASSIFNLGHIFLDLRDFVSAKRCYEQAKNIDQKIYGPDSPEVATDVNSLGTVLHYLYDWAGAKAYYEWALAIHKNHWGERDAQVAHDLSNLGDVLKDLDNIPDALKCYEEALSIDMQVHGSTHIMVASDLADIGDIYLKIGELTKAQSCFDQALATYKNHYPPNHKDIVYVQERLKEVKRMLANKKRKPKTF